MKQKILIVYFIISLSLFVYTHKLYESNDNNDYVSLVHASTGCIMYYHAFITSFVIYMNPSILKNTKFLTINSLLSILFSMLYYKIPEENNKTKHLFLILYLTCASILMAEFFSFIGNDDTMYSYMVLYILFMIDIIFFKPTNKEKLYMIHCVVSFILCIVAYFVSDNKTMFYGFAFNSLYGLVSLGWEYLDTEHLRNKKHEPVSDALKYFIDVEGLFTRFIL
jgi:hypothetical protein